MRCFIKAGVLSIIALTLSFSCTKKSSDSKVASSANSLKVFQYFRSDAFKSLDPMKQFDAASSEIVSNIYDTLLEYHYLARPYKLIPGLVVKMPELSKDGLTYIFTLRQGVKFHDDPAFVGGKGREMTASDVIYSIKRFADVNVNIKSYMLVQGMIEGLDAFREQTRKLGKKTDYDKLEIAGVKKLDKYRIAIKLTRNNPLALYPFAFSGMSIVPREAVNKYKDNFANHPVGTGPFYMKQYSRRGNMILARNPNYFGRYPDFGEAKDKQKGLLGDAGKQLPLVDEVHLPLIEEAQPAMLKFLKGELDWIGMNKDDFVRMAYKDKDGTFHLNKEYAKKFKMYTEPGLSAEFIRINMKDKVLGGNRALRQAIAYAMDVNGFVDLMYNGRGIKLNTIVPHPIAGSEADLGFQYYSKNLEMAKKKLIEAGYPGGKGLAPLTIEYRAATTTTRQAFEYIRNELAQVGIVVKANFQTFSSWLKRMESGNYQLSAAGWAADFPDGENFYQLLYGPNKTPGPNTSNFQHPKYDELYEKARFMVNGPERYKLFQQMSEIIKEEVPLILRMNTIRFGLYQSRLTNMKRNMMVNAPYKYLNIKF